MKNLTTLVAMITIIAVAPAEAGENWKVIEGPNGAVKGVWNVTIAGGQITGSAAMFDAKGKSVQYGLTGTVEGGAFTAYRLAPTNGVACIYRGQRQTGDAIQGSSICGPQSGIWKASPTK